MPTEHPQNVEAAVIGVPDPRSGEVVVASIVRRDAALTASDVDEHCHANMAAYKCPKRVEMPPV